MRMTKITKSNRVVKIISRRDEISLDEAQEIVQDTADEIAAEMANDEFGYDSITGIILNNLGLEPDYIEDLVAF